MGISYSFTAELWIYPGEGAWYFVTLPQNYAKELKEISTSVKRGFGSIKVRATVGKTTWDTSIFPDSKSKSYLLPIKKEIRHTNKLQAGSNIQLTLNIVGIK